jgi:hypothetical protein
MSFALMTLMRGIEQTKRVLCAREIQNTIKDSVHREITDAIDRYNLYDYYEYGESYIRSRVNDTLFLFKGLRHNKQEIKSTTGVDICWVEEAEKVSEESWRLLIPTIRTKGSEIWLTWNPEDEESATSARFIKNPPKNSRIVELNYKDNPFFPSVLEEERVRDLSLLAPGVYAHVWDGKPLTSTGDEIYGEYGPENHTTKTFSGGVIRWAHDFNYLPMSSAIIQTINGVDYVIDEIILDHASVAHSLNEFLDRYGKHTNCPVEIYGDPSGRAGEKHGLLSNYVELEGGLRAAGFNSVKRKVFSKTRSIRDGQASLRSRLLTADGKRHLFVNPETAPTVDRGFRTVKRLEGSTYQEDETNRSQHVISGLRYFSSYEYPVYGSGSIEVS